MLLCRYDGHTGFQHTSIVKGKRRSRCRPDRKWEDPCILDSYTRDTLSSKMGTPRWTWGFDHITNAGIGACLKLELSGGCDAGQGCPNIRRIAFHRLLSRLFCRTRDRWEESQRRTRTPVSNEYSRRDARSTFATHGPNVRLRVR
jgi:hypothetical protein